MAKKRNDSKILIIGGCGYIGSRLYEYLTSKEFSIDTLDLEWFGNYINPHNIKKDYSFLTEAFLSKYKTLILLAGHSSVAMCQKNMKKAFKNNVQNFIDLLDKINEQALIYASSSSIYGNTGNKKAKEKFNTYIPKNYYDLNKQEIDYYATLSKVKYVGLRLGTVNGFSPNLRSDLMINKMYSDGIKNGSIKISNTSYYRPILGINDLCRAMEKIINKPEKGIYNLASFNYTIGAIGQEVSKRMAITLKKGEDSPSYNFAIDTSKFQKTYNFKFTDSIDTIISSLKRNWKESHQAKRI